MTHADRLFLDRLDSDRLALRTLGLLAEGTGVADTGVTRIELACEFGPANHGKAAVNQDFAIAWHAHELGRGPDWAIAVADGLTSSFWSERAAALACLAGVRSLTSGISVAAETRAKSAFAAASDAIADYADALRDDPGSTHPKGEVPFVSTWKYMLGKGTLLRTTLALAWFEGGRFSLASVGDAGVIWREEGEEAILAACDLETENVYALGSLRDDLPDWDAWTQKTPRSAFQVALFTDGIGRGLGADPTSLWREVGRAGGPDGRNRAAEFLDRACRDRPLDYADNLTLALISSSPHGG